ncbi:hypothetical protein AFCDBAGC_3517 [Methylobacterium cerastii]|uniref:Uncharacterized protein n=1 Tax=Methylobacterium cerastii TaxID=932741 RepID=A0ABQ4QK66_9HYPH|nr:hypothetical protein AFCDBAGC_3517 [Methylobacterium cerastii]
MSSDVKRTAFEGQKVQASRNIENIKSHQNISIDKSSMLQKPENIKIMAGTSGYIKEINRSTRRMLIKFNPDTVNMVALWIDFSAVVTNIRYMDDHYGG